METLLERGRKSPICLHLICKDCVTSRWGTVEKIQECCSRRLLFICDIRVPGHGIGMGVKDRCHGFVVRSTMDKVNLRIALGRGGSWMDVMPTKVATPIESLLNRKVGQVLIAESFWRSAGN